MCRTRIDGPADADLVGRVAHLCLIGGQHAGARSQAADFARLAQQALAMLRR
ncbi:hypothetical protein [Burkholderia ubonensis]|uniref:hypothetical protein n=1 Tax=Burkholderia ubonensis TaxID=101571 RepID=UPI000B0AD4C4|nr:hypothetical protein [Burkholderia ubonensis]